MFCMKCGAKLPDGAQFCMSCGTAISGNTESNVKMVHLKCRECNGVMEVDPNTNTLVCPFCESKDVIIESDNVKIEQIKSDTYKTVELSKQQHEMDKIVLEEKQKDNALLKYYLFTGGMMLLIFIMLVVAKILGIE